MFCLVELSWASKVLYRLCIIMAMDINLFTTPEAQLKWPGVVGKRWHAPVGASHVCTGMLFAEHLRQQQEN